MRLAQRDEILDLLPSIPDVIEGSTQRTSPENLRWMLGKCLDEILVLPIDKVGRWIGFVHGVLAFSGHLDVDAVRDRSRPRFHHAYKETGQAIPPTRQLEDE